MPAKVFASDLAALLPAAAAAQGEAECNLKSNVSTQGQAIYHMPG